MPSVSAVQAPSLCVCDEAAKVLVHQITVVSLLTVSQWDYMGLG